MSSLRKDLRSALEKAIVKARDLAEQAATAALQALAVDQPKPFAHMDADAKALRNRLRERGRAAGDVRDDFTTAQTIGHLSQLVGYEHWHRMIFARFLAENGLLLEPEHQVALSLDDVQELAREEGMDLWQLAGSYAQRMLPEVFRNDDPALEVTLAREDRTKLEKLLADLDPAIFTAADSLGWTYQFWQTKRKDDVNKSGVKIGADEISPVTQLFTEDYMVDFLLDNTLGAWYAGKVLAANPALAETALSEEELRQACALPGCEWKYLRFVKAEPNEASEADSSSNIQNSKFKISWSPAAGTFDGWPKSAKELKCLDPCMGSGHFVVAMFERMVALRLSEEHCTELEAVERVIRDNLFGLEIDPRCTQIAAFNLALAAWRRVGHCKLPAMNLACSGLAPNTREADWVAIAGSDSKLRNGMERLYRLFKEAPVLGSLINPRAGEGDLLVAAFQELQPLLEKALAQETKDDTAHEMAVTARGLAKAAEILAGQFTLVATNVPYLGRGKQDEVLLDYCERVHPDAKADLATCFVERCINFCCTAGTTALVTPHSWLFLGTYKRLRKVLLVNSEWNSIARLGPGAFGTIGGEVVNVALVQITNGFPAKSHTIASIDVSNTGSISSKAEHLQGDEPKVLVQKNQLTNPDSCIQTEERDNNLPLLKDYADVYQGVGTTDNPQYLLTFWEVARVTKDWDYFQYSPEIDGGFAGFSGILKWEQGRGPLSAIGTAHKGLKAFGKQGFAVSVTSGQKFTRFLGYRFDNTIAVLLAQKPQFHNAVGAFLISDDFKAEVKKLDQALSVTESSFLKVPFDLAHWQKVAAEKYPHGLPKPFSSDPTQWLFNGHPAGADQPLHVAVARLLGYQWPRQTGSSFPDCPALGPDGLESLCDEDGIVCLTPLRGEAKAAERLRKLLDAAFADAGWNERQLLSDAGSKATNLEDWLRDEFFEQHAKLFHHRPFLWHLWDGRPDGFHALVNYHQLAAPDGAGHKLLESLTYAYLGDWIRRQKDDAANGVPGAEDRHLAAEFLQQELIQILHGEPPYDLFVRWKPLHQQAIAWHPDLNDGVRLNIRPFLLARDVKKKDTGILRWKPNVKWTKDRGSEPQRPKTDFPWFWTWDEKTSDFKGAAKFDGNRWNDLHYTNEAKQAARTRKEQEP